MKRLILLAIGCWLLTIGYAQQVIKVEKGNAKSLLDAVAQANKMNADKTAKQLFILIPDGFYDLGETVLTRITGYNIALIGQSMTGTIIQNKPDAKNEGVYACCRIRTPIIATIIWASPIFRTPKFTAP